MCVYGAFEGVLRGLGHGEGDEGNEGNGRGKSNEEELKKGIGIRGLYIKNLERSARLRNDIERILLLSNSSSTSTTTSLPCENEYLREKRAINMEFESESELQQRPHLQSLIQHIRSATQAKPHLLLAYMWVLYMALFSGGRYIRARLRGAGIRFWRGEEGAYGNNNINNQNNRLKVGDDDVDTHLSFWTFESEHDDDGEDLKAEFKARFASVEETTLTEAEKEDVVQEAVFVMRSIIAVVVETGHVFGIGTGGRWCVNDDDYDDNDERKMNGYGYGYGYGYGKGHKEEEDPPEPPNISWLLLLLKHVMPMGMVELITAAATTSAAAAVSGSAVSVPSLWTGSANRSASLRERARERAK